MFTTTIESDRFVLRPIEMSDAEDILELDSDPLVHKYLDNKVISSLEEAREIIEYIQSQYRDNNLGRVAIIDKSNGDFIGWSGLKLESGLRPGKTYYDLGYRLKTKYWGKGIGTETAKAVLNFGFTDLGLETICAAADVLNLASNKILTKIGMSFTEQFTFEGNLCNFYEIKRSSR